MREGNLKFKISRNWLRELSSLYIALLAEFEPEGAHELLVLECAKLQGHKLYKLLDRDQTEYTVQLTSVEALAFYQLWSNKPMAVRPYGCTIINSIIGKIDGKHKSSRVFIN